MGNKPNQSSLKRLFSAIGPSSTIFCVLTIGSSPLAPCQKTLVFRQGANDIQNLAVNYTKNVRKTMPQATIVRKHSRKGFPDMLG
jgi:hypothetical protein